MPGSERRVLHVLPHSGGGGETYVDLLGEMEGYRSGRLFLSPAVVRSLVALAGHARRYDLVHVHGEVAAALCLPVLATRPSVVTLHGLHLVRRLRSPAKRGARLSLGLVVRSAGRTICVSESERRQLALAVGRLAEGRAVVIKNGVALPTLPAPEERSATRAELGLSERESVGVWVGSLDPHKDPVTAAGAASRAGVTLLVVGEGPLASTLPTGAGAHVRLLGRRGDVPRLLAAADFFVLSSLREGLSLALLEALAAGLPTVVSDVPENIEAVGDTGLAVAARDESAFAAAFRRLAEDAALRKSLGEAARRRAERLFRSEVMVERTREIYEAVLAERHPRKRPLATAK
jgi:glycosyltransferase involved in cell wall biosynthesis